MPIVADKVSSFCVPVGLVVALADVEALVVDDELFEFFVGSILPILRDEVVLVIALPTLVSCLMSTFANRLTTSRSPFRYLNIAASG
jgi:hypothetical protein